MGCATTTVECTVTLGSTHETVNDYPLSQLCLQAAQRGNHCLNDDHHGPLPGAFLSWECMDDTYLANRKSLSCRWPALPHVVTHTESYAGHKIMFSHSSHCQCKGFASHWVRDPERLTICLSSTRAASTVVEKHWPRRAAHLAGTLMRLRASPIQ